MFSSRQDSCRQEAEWLSEVLFTKQAMCQLIDRVVSAMAGAQYSPTDIFAFRLALEEALVNAFIHGNRNEEGKRVTVSYCVEPSSVAAEIEDEGEGFDPIRVPDPTDAANLTRPGGRGIFLMKTYLTGLSFNGRGNGVRLYKEKSLDGVRENDEPRQSPRNRSQ